MATIYPKGKNPLIFAATLPRDATDTENAPIGSQNATSFSTIQTGGSNPSMTLRFVTFAYPNANNGAAGAPRPPLVEIRAGGGPWRLLASTAGQGDASFSIGSPGSNQLVDYSFLAPDSHGVTTLVFLRNNTPFGNSWDIRFTANDGVTGSPALPRTGLTFTVDAGAGVLPWLAVPKQQVGAALPSIDFSSALAGLTLAGTESDKPVATLVVGHKYAVALPVGNYGPGPLTVSDFAGVSRTEPVDVSSSIVAPFTVAPGSANGTFLSASVSSNKEANFIASFAVQSDDPLANTSAIGAHDFSVDFSGHFGAPPSPPPPPPHPAPPPPSHPAPPHFPPFPRPLLPPFFPFPRGPHIFSIPPPAIGPFGPGDPAPPGSGAGVIAAGAHAFSTRAFQPEIDLSKAEPPILPDERPEPPSGPPAFDPTGEQIGADPWTNPVTQSRGHTVILTGTNFGALPTTSVRFEGANAIVVPAGSADILSVSATTIQVNVPAALTVGAAPNNLCRITVIVQGVESLPSNDLLTVV